MQVILGVSDSFVALSCPLRGHIEINDNLDLRDIDTTGEKICCDNHTDLIFAELSDHFITLLRTHISKDDSRLEILSPHHVVKTVSVSLGVDKDDCLGHLAYVEDLLEEVRLLTLLTSVLELLDMVELELLWLEINLLGHRSELANSRLHILSVSSREEDVLHLLW